MNGYFADENTLFRGVKLVPSNSELKIKDNKIDITYIDNTFESISTIKPNKEFNEMLKKSYIESFKAVPKDTTLNIGITGGKDSRLALLGALEADYKIKTNTRGFLDNPDVLMAGLITDTLGLDHKVTKPKISKEKGISVNIEEKALKAMIATSGQVYGYENISYQPNFKGNIGLTGVAALTMKGGYSNLNNLNVKNSKSEMIKRFLPLEELLVKGTAEKYKENLGNLITSDFQDAQYKHALFYRNGRWTSGTRLAKSYSSDIYSPYYDNCFTKDIIKVQKKFLDNGFIQYTLTNKLNSEISLLPLVGSRWGFEKNQPVKPANYKGWLEREPLYPKTKLANYNWRNITLKENHVVRNQFKELLLANPNHKIFQIIDYKAFKNVFDRGLTNKHLKFTWSALSLFAYINFLENKPMTATKINIKLPETVLNEVNTVPETRDLMGELKSINDGLTMVKKADAYIFTINKNVKKNRYITVFSNNISIGTQHSLADIFNYKSITFNSYIESKEKQKFSYAIIFFSNKKKIKTEWFSNRIDKNLTNLHASTLVPKEATNFKIAIKVSDKLSSSFKIRYLFVKVE